MLLHGENPNYPLALWQRPANAPSAGIPAHPGLGHIGNSVSVFSGRLTRAELACGFWLREKLEVLEVGQCCRGRTFQQDLPPIQGACGLPHSCACRVTSFPPHEYTQVHIHGFEMATEPVTSCMLIWSLHVSWVMSLSGEFRAQGCPSAEAPAYLVTRGGSCEAEISLLGWQTSTCPTLTR